jgi:DNA-binding CsgD family transcriptional regulator
VLARIGLGWSDAEIGADLGISEATARTHRSRLLRKLGLVGTPKLMAWAVEHGFTMGLRGERPVAPR